MNIIPKLNLNKHPSEVSNGSLIDATNLTVSKDYSGLQSEPSLVSSAINDSLNNLIEESYNIVYCVACSKELLLFIKVGDVEDSLQVYRYSENQDAVEYVTEIEYNGGNIIADYTYNKENLIVAVSEYFDDDSNKVPLKIINFGKFGETIDDADSKQLYNKSFHSICPEVKIPTVGFSYINGNTYKGWYYVFIRYKISTNTYTQWFDTNTQILVDSYYRCRYFRYYVSYQVNTASTTRNVYTNISDDKEIATISFKLDISNIDNNYDELQLGFVCFNKSNSYCYNSADLNIESDNAISFEFNSSNVETYAASDLIISYYNYYNIKALSANNNRLYIGNYQEDSIKDSLINDCKDITVTFKSELKDRYSSNSTSSNYAFTYTLNTQSVTAVAYRNDSNGVIYQIGTSLVIWYTNSDTLEVRTIEGNVPITLEYVNIKSETETRTVNAEDLFIMPMDSGTSIDGQIGVLYFLVDDTYISNISEACYLGSPYIRIVSIGNEELSEYACIALTYYNEAKISVSWNNASIASVITTSDVLYNKTIFPYNPYNFFIHFVDKYGYITNGINISYFNVVLDDDIESVENNIGNKLLYFKKSFDFAESVLKANVSIDKIPDGYVGWYLSYEQIEYKIKYFGLCTPTGYDNIVEVLNDRLNYDDSINFDFDTIRIYNNTSSSDMYNSDDRNYMLNFGDYSYNYTQASVINKVLYVADVYNNIGKATHIRIELNTAVVIGDYNVCVLYKSTNSDYYNKKVKTLIPCTSISYVYGENNSLELNSNDCFISEQHAAIYTENTYYNDTTKLFYTSGSSDIITSPLSQYHFYAPIEVPMEFIRFNNEPVVTFFPATGLNTTDEYDKSFVIGNIVECKNTVDLYQQIQDAVYNLHPKTLDWYDESVLYDDKFSKTIRRSSVIQDESNEIAWRYFGTEDYKYISENKGDIVKLISVGYYFIVHTEYSMFLFNSTDTINSNEGNIQLSSVDIWDIDYKEIITSSLGYAGLQKEYHGILGNFGYVFYDADAKRIYRYDNSKVDIIDGDIINLLQKLSGYDVYITDDKYRDRILFRFFKDDVDDIVLSYNYNTNTFISRHLYEFYRGFSTKENTYLIGKKLDTENNNVVYKYSDNVYNDVTINVMFNANYELMKYLEFILYKLSKVTEVSDNVVNIQFPVEGTSQYYAGDLIRIYSAYCDTGDIDVTFNEPENTINRVTDYAKPYWRLGNWHFNAIRNKLSNYINKEIAAEDSSRVYGNWFVIMFTCKGDKCIEFESIDVSTTKGENV